MKFVELDEKEEMISEFMDMKNNAELRALSNYSLETPLTDEQYEKMMELKKILIEGDIDD